MEKRPSCAKIAQGVGFCIYQSSISPNSFSNGRNAALYHLLKLAIFRSALIFGYIAEFLQADHDLFSLYNGLFRQAALENPPIMLLTKLYLHSIIMCKVDSFINQL